MAPRLAGPTAQQSASHVSLAARITSVPNVLSIAAPTAPEPPSSVTRRRHTRSSPNHTYEFHALSSSSPTKIRRREPSKADWRDGSDDQENVNPIPVPVTSPDKVRTSPRRRNMEAAADGGQHQRQEEQQPQQQQPRQHHQHHQRSTLPSPVNTSAQVTPSLHPNVMAPSPWRMENPFAFSTGPHMLHSQLYENPLRAGDHMPAITPFINDVHRQQLQPHSLHQHQPQNQLSPQLPQHQLQPNLPTSGYQSPYPLHYQHQQVQQPFGFGTRHPESAPSNPRLLPPLVSSAGIRQPSPPPRDIPNDTLVAPFESIAERRKTISRTAGRIDSESLSNASDTRSQTGAKRRASEPVGGQDKSKPKPKRHNQYTAPDQLSQDPSAIARRKSRTGQPALEEPERVDRCPQSKKSDQVPPPSLFLEETTPEPLLTMPTSSKAGQQKLTPARARNRAISRIFNQLQRGATNEADRQANSKKHWIEANRRYEEEEMQVESEAAEEDVKTEEPADTIQVHSSPRNPDDDAHGNADDSGLPLDEQEYVPEDKARVKAGNSTSRFSDISGIITAAAAKGIKVTPGSLRDIELYTTPDEDLDWSDEPDKDKRQKMQSVISSRKHLANKKAEKANNPAATKVVTNLRKGRSAGNGSPRAVKRPRRRVQEDVTTVSTDLDKEGEDEVEAEVEGGDSVDEPAEEMEVAQLSQEEALNLSDEEFINQMKEVLAARSERGKPRDFGFKQAGRILTLLNLGELVTESSEDALFTTPEGAAEWCQAGKFFEGPIFVNGAQPLPLQTVDQFFDEHYDDSIYVHVQDPAIRLAFNSPHVRKVKLGEVKKRFAKGTTDKPWNCLELAAHVEDGLRPSFLNNEDCRLLTKVKFPSKEDEASRNGYTMGWKEVEKWALVAQGGALTEPHQDSHGYSTYITINQGLVGYGWLARPTEEERAAWNRSHTQYTGGRWRYTICRPGQTVYFPAGTVHFVFRLPAVGPTLAFGGHVLRNSQIVHWVKTLIAEQAAPEVANEDLTVSAPAYLNRVHKFVLQALKGDPRQTMKWGGTASIAEFMELKTKYEDAVDRTLEELGLNGRKGRGRKRRATSDE